MLSRAAVFDWPLLRFASTCEVDISPRYLNPSSSSIDLVEMIENVIGEYLDIEIQILYFWKHSLSIGGIWRMPAKKLFKWPWELQVEPVSPDKGFENGFSI